MLSKTYPKKGYKFLTNAVMTLEIAGKPCYNSVKAAERNEAAARRNAR